MKKWVKPKTGGDKKLIPHGSYCYVPRRMIGTHMEILPCPYYYRHPGHSRQDNGYCSYIGHGDWMSGSWGTLWDMVKECGVNTNDGEL